MPQWILDLTMAQVVGGLGVITIVGGALWRYGRPVAGVIRRMTDLADAVLGAPEKRDRSGAIIRPAQPGIIAQVATIHHETTPNHGGSMKDAVRRIEQTGATTAAKLDEHIRIAKESDARLADLDRIVRHAHPDL